MLEQLVSSRIRRTLVEYLLVHPSERFYLRGLAKQLGLSISPLRRELLRLEQAGMLTATDEGSLRFYLVNQTSPLFIQLQQVSGSLPPVSMPAAVVPTAPVHPQQPVKRARRWPIALALSGSLAVMMLGVGMYQASRSHSMVARHSSSVSGEMASGRWRLMPGAVGGFSSTQERN